METAEEKLQDALLPFLCSLFRRFHSYKETWNQALNLITELDCLASLSIVSGQQVGVMCRPEFIAYDSKEYNTQNKNSILDIRQLRHPCVSLADQSKQFVPNDTLIAPSRD